ncbi:MAG TPA: L-threonylcarbamoyladenylate synthase [Candidatus Baltobacteraceae bacterium]|jgi:L-threonylcarbamoyladenylate synthase
MNVGTIIDARNESIARVVEEVARVTFGGGTAIFPTDTVYGIGCDPYDSRAIARIYGTKRRPDAKPLTLHLASIPEFLEYAKDNALAIAAGRRLFPGPVTLIVRRPAFISEDVTSGLPTLGFRVPDDPLCLAILERCGPLAATSANISGQLAYRGTGERDGLPAADLLVENGPTRYLAESTVIDLTGPQPRVLREGVVGYERLTELLGPVIRQTVTIRNP